MEWISWLYIKAKTQSLVLVLVLLSGIHLNHCRPTKWSKPETPVAGMKSPFTSNTLSGLDPVSQLHKYGYFNKDYRNKTSADITSISDALGRFQEFYGLNVTGVLDNDTLSLMAKPRCGTPDIMNSKQRKKRYVAVARWRNSALTYRIGPTTKMPFKHVKATIERALKTWSDVSSLSFTWSDYGPFIDMIFRSGHHGDNNPFDGPGGVLAHAFFPYAGGAVHFDEDERWTSGSRYGVNLFQIAAHELGHSLGLAHSQVRSALMFPYYRGYQSDFKLDSDDIAGIQSLYGPNRNPNPNPNPNPYPNPYPTPSPTQSPTPSPTPNPYPNPDPTAYPGAPRCAGDGTFSAIFSINRITYAIEGMKFYKLTLDGLAPGYPKHVHEVLSRKINKVDTSLVVRQYGYEVLYIFEDDKVWKFNKDLRMDPRWRNPQLIQDQFPNLLYPIDSAFFSKHFNAIYFFKDSRYYRSSGINSYQDNYKIDNGYPREIRIWNFGNEVHKVNAIFTWVQNRRMYLFSGHKYYRYNEDRLEVDNSTIPYPRDVRKWWLGCSNIGNAMEEIRHENSTGDVVYHEEPLPDWENVPPAVNISVPFDSDHKPAAGNSTEILIQHAKSPGLAGEIVFEKESSSGEETHATAAAECLMCSRAGLWIGVLLPVLNSVLL